MKMADVKIRYREVIATAPTYGRFGEYQVVLNRKIIFRADTKKQAERWTVDHGHTVTTVEGRE